MTHFHKFVWLALVLIAVQSCDIAKDTADSSKGGAKGAVGIAGKMHNGTAGDADLDSGESSSDKPEDGGQ
jgi:hypothetical protein